MNKISITPKEMTAMLDIAAFLGQYKRDIAMLVKALTAIADYKQVDYEAYRDIKKIAVAALKQQED